MCVFVLMYVPILELLLDHESFIPENKMHGLLKKLVCLPLTFHKIWEDPQKFYHKNSLSRQNGMNHENFKPRKFGAIRYVCNKI